jgi:hypothetical protein
VLDFLKQNTANKKGTYPLNRALLDVIAPMDNLDFKPFRATLDGRKALDPEMFLAGPYYRQILGCESFQSLNEIGWADALLKNPNAITSVVCEPYEKSRIKKDVDTQSSRMNIGLDRGGTASKQHERQQTLDHADTMLRILGDDDARFFKTTIYSQILGHDEVELKQRVKDAQDSYDASSGIKAKTARHNQATAFLGASPLMAFDKTTQDQCYKPMPAVTLGGALLFSKSGLDDGDGATIGADPIGGVIRLNTMEVKDTRPNRNAIVLGMAGTGKTTLMQKIILDDIAKGSLVICIDPEREQRTLCKNVHGQWINLGGKSKYRISPLRPRATGVAADDNDDATSIYMATQHGEVLSETVGALRTFFKIAFGLTRQEIDYMEQIFKTEYGRFGITYTTPLKDIDVNKHPVMEDIYRAVKQKADEAPLSMKKELDNLAGKLWPAVEGSLASLWSGTTNIAATSNFVVLDTQDLNGRDDAIKSAQYFNLLTWIWDQIVQSRITGRTIRIVIDECHLVLNKEMDSAAQFVAMLAKRIRKYYGGLMCATQQVTDLDAHYGEALMDQAAYKFLLSMKGKNLRETQRIFYLTDDITRQLEQGNRGQGVIIAGSEKIWGQINVSDFEKRYFYETGAV